MNSFEKFIFELVKIEEKHRMGKISIDDKFVELASALFDWRANERLIERINLEDGIFDES